MINHNTASNVFEIIDFMVEFGESSDSGNVLHYEDFVLTSENILMQFTLRDTRGRTIFEYDALDRYISISDLRVLDSILELFYYDVDVMKEEGYL